MRRQRWLFFQRGFFRFNDLDAHSAEGLGALAMDRGSGENDACRHDTGRFGVQLPLAFQPFLNLGSYAGGNFNQDVLAIEDQDIELFARDAALFHLDTKRLFEYGGNRLAKETFVANAPTRAQSVNGAMQLLKAGLHPRLKFGKALVHLFKALVHLFEASVHLFKASVHLFEASVHLFEASVHLLEALVHLFEAHPCFNPKFPEFRQNCCNFFLARKHLEERRIGHRL